MPLPQFTSCLFRRIVFFVFGLTFFTQAVQAQATISLVNTNYSTDFNSFGSSAIATLPTGFRIGTDWLTGTTATTLAAGTTGTGVLTSSSTGGCYNFGNGITASATDRALGFLSSSGYTSPRSIIYAFTNSTGQTITSLTLSWNYEKYRSGSRAYDWTFFHGSTSTATTAFTSGNQSYIADASTSVIYNPPSSISKAFTITSLNIANGATYYLRWTYTGSGGSTNGQALGIDDLNIAANRVVCSTPTAQPTSIAFSNIGVNTLYGSFSAASPAPDNYLILANLDNTLTVNPTNGSTYQVGDAVGDAIVIQAGAGTTFSASGLNAGTTYYFFV
ncbi:MAG: hypothetical protein ACKO6Q_08525, partial [Bacteroidota bacterium]